jgi:Flp pilus assembly protein TadD
LADIGILRAAIAPVRRLWRRSAAVEVASKIGDDQDARAHFRDGLVKRRGGDSGGAIAAFECALALAPDLADAVMARAEILDSLGRSDEAHGEYERARRLWSELPPGAADRRYIYRRQGYFAFEAESYDLVRSNVRSKILPQLAHGNACLAHGRAAEALDSYERALKVNPKLTEVLALKGEALSTLGRYQEAIEIFDGVLAAHPKDGDTLNARGIARAALGRLAEANDDWRQQFDLLPQTSSAARACVAMRMANYSAAYNDFGLAIAKEPGNSYWLLYRLTAARLAGAPSESVTLPADDHWPTLLLAFRTGQATEETLLNRANSPARHAEARFQMGVLSVDGNPAAARRYWREVVDQGPPALIEFAAASNELARLGA